MIFGSIVHEASLDISLESYNKYQLKVGRVRIKCTHPNGSANIIGLSGAFAKKVLHLRSNSGDIDDSSSFVGLIFIPESMPLFCKVSVDTAGK